MAVNAINYIKNVGRSFGYAAVESFKDSNPVVTALIKSNKEYSSQIYESIRDLKSDNRKLSERLVDNEYTGLISEAATNIFADIKSGNWYNKDRKDKYELEASGVSMDDFDFDDFDFDDLDSESSTTATISSDEKNTKEISNKMDDVGSRTSRAISMATAKSADYIVASQMKSTQLLLSQNNQIFSKINIGLGAVNSNLAALSSLAQPITTHMQNSAVFYTKSTELQEKQVKLLEQLVENSKPAPANRTKYRSSRSKTLGDFIDSDGSIDFGSYLGNISGNIKELTSFFTDLNDSMKSEDGKGGILRQFIASPTEFLVSKVTDGFIKKITKGMTEEFNNTLSGFLSASLKKVNNLKNSSNPVLSFLGGLLGFDDSMKTSINTSKYQKGKVDFDGITRKSIIQVIPTYLSKILAAITGGKETRFDFNTGKFISTGDIAKEKEEMINRGVNQSSYEIREALKEQMRLNGKQQEEISQLIDNFQNYFKNAVVNNRTINPNKKYTAEDFKKYGLDEASGNELLALFKGMEKRGKYSTILNHERNISEARTRIGESFARAEEEDGNILIYGEDGSLSSIFDGSGTMIYSSGRGKGKKAKGVKSSTSKASKASSTANNVKSKATSSKMSQNDFFDLFGDAMDYAKKESLYNEYIMITDPEEQKRFIDKALNAETLKSNLKNKAAGTVDSFKDSSLGGKIQYILNGFNNIINKPSELVGKVLEKADKTMYNIIYGNPDGKSDDNAGFLGNILNKTNELFGNFNNWINDNILNPITDKLDIHSFKDVGKKILGIFGIDSETIGADISAALFGTPDGKGKRNKDGLFSNIGTKIMDNFKGIGGFIKDAFVGAKDGVKNFKDKITGAANGRKITKTGLVAVSEGELIIPSEYNPFYRGITNKAQQIKNENEVISNFYGAFNTGGTAGAEKEAADIPRNKDGSYDKRSKQYKKWAAKYGNIALDKLKSGFNTVKNKAKTFYNGEDGQGGYVKDVIHEAYGGVKSVIDAFFPKDVKGEKSKITDMIKTSAKEAGINIDGVITGGLVGGGLSLFTGGIISPMLGASIGAASGLIIKSNTVQDMLFGKEIEGKDGEREGGLLPKKVSDFIFKQLPSYAKSSSVGALLSLIPGIPGGPVVGAIMGSAVNFASKNSKVQEFLFGNEEFGTKGIFGDKSTKEFIKKGLPKAGAGALLGLVAGPFGLAGNIIAGGALGFASQTNSFQEALFGKKNEKGEREGGLIGWIKDTLKPVQEAIKPIGKEITFQTKRLFKSLRIKLKESLGIPLIKKLEESILRPFMGILGKAISPISNIIQLPFKAIGNIGTNLKKKQIRKGYATYMTAKERIKFRNDNNMGRDNTSLLDEAMASEDKEGLSKIKSDMNLLRSEQKTNQKEASGILAKTSAKLYSGAKNIAGLSIKNSTKIMKYVQDGKMDKATQFLSELSANGEISQQQFDHYSKVIEEGRAGYVGAKDKLANAKGKMGEIYKNLKNKFGIDVNDKNAWKFEDIIDAELKHRDANPEEERLLVEQKNHSEIVDKIQEVIDAIKDPTGKKKKKKGNGSKEDTPESEDDKVDEDKKQVPDDEGNLLDYTKSSSGNWILDKASNINNKLLEKKEAFKAKIAGLLPAITGMSTSITGLIGGFKDKLFGKDKKEGIFGKLFSFFTGKGGLLGENGILSGLFSFFTNTPIGALVKGVLSKVTLSGVISSIMGPALLVGGFSGLFDDFFAKLTGDVFGSGKDDKLGIGLNGETLSYDETSGQYYNSKGEVIDPKDISSYKVTQHGAAPLSSQLKENLGRGLVTGRGSITSLLGRSTLKKTVGKDSYSLIKKTVQSRKAMVLNGADDASKALASSNLSDLFEKFGEWLKHVPGMGKFADNIDELVIRLFSSADDAIKVGGKQALNTAIDGLAKLNVVSTIVFFIGDFTTGYQDARNTFQITDRPTTGQKLISGIVKALLGLIPFIGSLIPEKTIVDIVLNWIAPLIGLDVKQIMDQREAAKAEAEAAGFGSVTEYLKTDKSQGGLGDYTWTEDLGNRFKTMKENIKQKGVGGALIDYTKDKFNVFKESMEGGEGSSEALAKTIESMFPSFIADPSAAIERMRGLMLQGKTKELINYSYADEDDNMLEKVFKQIPLIGSKFLMVVPSMFCNVFQPVVKAVTSITDKIITAASGIGTNIMGVLKYGISGDTKKMWEYTNSVAGGEDENGEDNLSGIQKALLYGAAVITTPIAVSVKTGKLIFNALKERFKTIKSEVVTGVELIKLASNGDVKGMWDYDPASDEDNDNEINTFTKIAAIATKVLLTPTAAMKAVSNKIKEEMGPIIEATKKAIGGVSDDMKNINTYSKDGNVAGMWGYAKGRADDEENPLSGFQKMLLYGTALIKSPMAMMRQTSNTLFGPVKEMMGRVGKAVGSIGEELDSVKNYAKEGNIVSLWGYVIGRNIDEENPLSGFQKTILYESALVVTPIAMMTNTGKALKLMFGESFEKCKINIEAAIDASSKISEAANNKDLAGIWAVSPKFEGATIDPLFGFTSSMISFSKIVYSMITIVEKLLYPIKSLVNGLQNGTEEFMNNSTTVQTMKAGVKETNNKRKGFFSGVKGALLNWIGGDSGLRGGNSGFVSQNQYKSSKYGNTTLADKGCAPAVASMITGKPMSSTANYAINKGYANSNGTSADYFGDVLSKNGIQSEYVTGGNSEYLASRIASGSPTVLLGQDPTNKSKANSPFGPGNHYVLANGMDRSGNIIVQDPESNSPNKKYSSSILNKVKLGIPTGGRSLISSVYRRFSGGDTQSNKEAIWAFLRSKGCSEEVTAGIMGNLQQESQFDPTAVEKPKTPDKGGHGIAQWTGARWTTLKQYASTHGKDWTDLDLQLNLLWEEFSSTHKAWLKKVNSKYGSLDAFMKGTDLEDACTYFCKHFEVAGEPKQSNRLNYAKQVYSELSGKEYTYNGSTSGTSGSSGSSGNSITSLAGMFGNLLSSFYGDTIGSLFGFSSNNADTSGTTTGSTTGPGSQKQKELVDRMKSVEGKLTYSQSGPRDPDKGSADCSSTVNWAYKKVFGKDIGGNTVAQIQNNDFVPVDQSGIQENATGTGSAPNIDKLQPGDLLFYKGKDKSRPYGVGHVEMYMGDNQNIGHGKGMGPKINTTTNYRTSEYIMAKRLNNMSGAGSGLVDIASTGRSSINRSANNNSNLFSGGGSMRHLSAKEREITAQVNKTVRKLSGGSSMNDDILIPLIKTIIGLLTNVSNNTSKLDNIIDLLSKSLGLTAATAAQKSSEPAQKSEIDSSAQALIDYMNQLAAG